MGNACFFCPKCGFKECGEHPRNTCPACGYLPGEGIGARHGPIDEKMVCKDCGMVSDAVDRCIRCDSDNLGPLMPTELSHEWFGHELMCKNTGKITTMPPDVAMEIPYCPYCMETLVGRPDFVAEPVLIDFRETISKIGEKIISPVAAPKSNFG
jgi:hypothetical protein